MYWKRSLGLGAAAVFMSGLPAFAQQAETDGIATGAAEEAIEAAADAAFLADSEIADTVMPASEAPSTASPAGSSGASAQSGPGPVTLAESTDVVQGVEVRGPQGELVGTIEAVDSEGAIVSTGETRAKLPFESFGKNGIGLVISLSRSELEAAAAAADPT